MNDIKKQNWNAIARFVGNKESQKKIFLDQASPDTERDLVRRLILAPEIDENLLEGIENSIVSTRDKLSLFGDLCKLQTSSFYFGNHSLLKHKEKNIFDFLQVFEEDITCNFAIKNWVKRKPSLSRYFETTHASRYLMAHSVADHIQTWREVYRWKLRLLSVPKDMTEEERVIDPSTVTANNLLRVEIACRHPETLNKNVVSLAHKMRDVLTDSEMPDLVRSTYDEVVSSYLDQKIADGTGGRVTLAVKYETQEQLKAMLPLLDPDTRYPNTGVENEDEMILRRPLIGEDRRVSHYMIAKLWENNMIFEDIRTEGTLLTCTMGAHLYMPLGVGPLGYDAVNLAERVESKKALKGDSNQNNAKLFPNSFVVETLNGRILAGTWAKPVPIDEFPWLQQLGDKCESHAELASVLCEDDYQKKLSKAINKKYAK